MPREATRLAECTSAPNSLRAGFQNLKSCLREASVAALRNKIRIKPVTPNAPTCGSFMISSLRSTGALTSKPSQQSARPSRCSPPVSRTQTMRAAIPATSGGNINVAPFQASHVRAPMTSPTNGYHTDGAAAIARRPIVGESDRKSRHQTKGGAQAAHLFLVAHTGFAESCHFPQDPGRGFNEMEGKCCTGPFAETQI